MIVDDSAIALALTKQILHNHDKINVVASAQNPRQALAKFKSNPGIEAVVLDIEIPNTGGLTALSSLIDQDPNLKVIMASNLKFKDTEVIMEILNLGACDHIVKPDAQDGAAVENFGDKLADKIISHVLARRDAESLNENKKNQIQPSKNDAAVVVAAKNRPKTSDSKISPEEKTAKSPIVLRALPPSFKPKILAIGSSTGGPQALFSILLDIGTINLPILIVQHMPATFTPIFANHIGSICGHPASEAVDGEEIRDGHIYIAPGDHHMMVRKKNQRILIHLNQEPPVNFCRPAVDPMLESVAQTYGPQCMTLILTGMGQDGAQGSQSVVESGGVVIAQDEKTSTIWGMPGAVASKGLCSAVLPLQEIGSFIRTVCLK